MSRSDSHFARVYEEHVWDVYGFLAYRVRDRELAEDLTQATFERALRAWPRFDPRKASERTWLLVIARNLLIDHHRRWGVDRSTEIDERVLPPVQGPEDQTALRLELGAALEQLGKREREVITLRFGADLTGPEIALVTGLTVANVQQIISRTLRRLRTMIEEESASEDDAHGSVSLGPG